MATKPAKKAPAKKAPAKRPSSEPIKIDRYKDAPTRNGKPGGPAKKSVNPQDVKQLKGASYNPRVVTDRAMRQLKHSLVGIEGGEGHSFGDLSGVVFNRIGGVLVSGHQRIKSIEGLQSRLVKKEVKKDGYGTVAVGHIEVKTKRGTVHLPYREVEWTDAQVERAGNIRANVSAGEFDQEKLGKILQGLQQGEFEIETLGLNALDAQKAMIAHRNSERGAGLSKHESRTGRAVSGGEEESDGEFEAVDVEEVEADLSVCCPRCKFRFEPKGKRK